MSAKRTDTAIQLDDHIQHYSRVYLQQYWPEEPSSPTGWADNAVLMLAYQEAALAVLDHFSGRAVRALDVSTGPALAPLLAMITAISEVQLSDYNEDNRRSLHSLPIEYWRNYVPMLIKLYPRPEQRISEILARLDMLRSAKKPVVVDLFRENPFPAEIRPHDYELITMNFVADGITETEGEYLRCLGRVTDMVRPGGAFSMSAVVDSPSWDLGPTALPSPNVSEETIVNFLRSQNFEILQLSRSMRHIGLTYGGGWIVLAARRMK